jgi:hypothetical protein
MEEIRNLFTYHRATLETGPQHEAVRTLLRQTALKLSGMLPPSPEATLAIRKLQESMFYANSAIACRQQ